MDVHGIGIGIGLTIAQALVEMHGGQLEASEGLGKRSTTLSGVHEIRIDSEDAVITARSLTNSAASG